MNKKCIGCGLMLQTDDEKKEGYTPDLKNDYCKRCFRLKNYGEQKSDEQIDEKKLLKRINEGTRLVFFLIDFFNISQNTISIFKKIRGKKVLIISKSDILRKEMKPSKIMTYLKDVYQIQERIVFISNKKPERKINIYKILDEEQIRTAYITGITNAGKSTWINRLLEESGKKKKIVTSDKPNTTLDFIPLHIKEYHLYDTPGFSYENQDRELINREIKPVSFVIKENTTIFLGNKYVFSFDKPNRVVFWGNIPIRREYKIPNTIQGKISIPKNYDIVLPGIGFINIKEACIIKTNMKNLETRIDISEGKHE